MRSLRRRHASVDKKNPYWSTYICFWHAVKSQEFNVKIIHRWFNRLVDKDDYSTSDKKSLLKDLVDLKNDVEDDRK